MSITRGSLGLPSLAASVNRVCMASRSRRYSNALRSSFSSLQTCNKTDRRRFTSSAPRPAATDLSGLKDVLRVSEEVADAVATNKPVVALESTIYTHGAFEEDLGLEEIVRQHGGVPAVCGVYNGVATVGLEKHEVQEMVHGNPAKLSRRDLALIVGDGLRGVKRHGGTTIAGTMILARLAGIRVFGTGGLGGVHRGAEKSMDISADLTELGRTRVAVISAGCKGFLDIPRTLEYLETQGVVVATFNRGGEDNKDVTFPAFWARNSGVKSPSHVLSPEDAAYKIYAQEKLGIESGLLLANPIPKGADIPREVMEDAIERAVRDADREGFNGSNNTPFILQRIREYTQGRSVAANLALVRDNVAVAAMVAERLSHILRDGPSASDLSNGKPLSFASSKPVSVATQTATRRSPVKPEPLANEKVKPIMQSDQERSTRRRGLEEEHDQRADIVVAGSVALDLSCDYTGSQSGTAGDIAESPSLHTSNPASITQSVGGVGHNVALAAHRFGGGDVKVKLCSVVGDDVAGSTLLDAIRAEGLSVSGIRKLGGEKYPGARTAQYVSVNDSQKSLVLAMADMDILTAHPFPKDHWAAVIEESQPRCLVVDANWDATTIRSLLSVAGGAKTIFEPVSAAKSVRLFEGEKLGVYPNHQVSLATPNIYELSAMYDAAKEQGYFHNVPEWFEVIDSFNVRGSDIDYGEYFERMMASTSAEVQAAGVPQKVLHLLPYIQTIVVKFGEHGCLLAEIMAPDDKRLVVSKVQTSTAGFYQQQQSVLMRALPCGNGRRVGGVYMRYFNPEKKVEDVVSVNGVGDTFLGVLTAGLARGGTLHKLIGLAQSAAVMTLMSKEAVSPKLEKLSRKLRKGHVWWSMPLMEEERKPVGLDVEEGFIVVEDLSEAKKAFDGENTVDGPNETYSELSRKEGRLETEPSTAGEWPGDEGLAAVQDAATSETVLEGYKIGKDEPEQSTQHMPLAAEVIGSSAGDQETSTAEHIPESGHVVKNEKQSQHIPVAERIHEALAKMGVSKEEAGEAIKAVAAGGPREFAKWKANYIAKVAAEKAAAKAKARRIAELDKEYARENPQWGSFAKRELQDTLLRGQEVPKKDELSAFDKEIMRVGEDEPRVEGDTQHNGTWEPSTRHKVDSSSD